MTDAMAGIRVIEIAAFGFVPTAGAVLGAWGAEVIKIEHPEYGDPARGLATAGIQPGEKGVHFLWEVFNRGKKSVGLDLASSDGQQLLYRLIDGADVLLTNFLAPARKKLGLNDDTVRARNPQIIYARGTSHGNRGSDAEMGGFDGMSYWYRSGLGMAARSPGVDFPVGLPVPAFGDIQTGTHLAGGVAAALFRRERTGEGATVDTSLMLGGLWASQGAMAGAFVLDAEALPRHDRARPQNPLHNQYMTKDRRVLALSLLQADRYWPGLCEAIGRPDLIDDPRFATARDRKANVGACVKLLDEIFAARTLEQWKLALATQEGPWAPVQTTREALNDPQAEANKYIQYVQYDNGTRLPLVPSPVHFDDSVPHARPAPKHGADTDDVFLAAGLDWDEILDLKVRGVIT
jgi:crotonobetainyl-CoA:carnitine CoA-transferase CaiB-like acyl-CoA transferase